MSKAIDALHATCESRDVTHQFRHHKHKTGANHPGSQMEFSVVDWSGNWTLVPGIEAIRQRCQCPKEDN
ncbi:MAG TPA: hypothetical protein VGT08_17395 [Terracidiphilus sp.]|nr:hypothetical protein [Terracidiphilus sp.]